MFEAGQKFDSDLGCSSPELTMKLSTSILQAVMGCTPPDSDRTTNGRFAVSKRAMLSRSGSTVLIPVTIVSVTNDSLGLIKLAPMPEGEQFNLSVVGRNGNRLSARCMAIGCNRTVSGRFWIDAELLHVVEESGPPAQDETGRQLSYPARGSTVRGAVTR
jgi:hypothetical protein